MGDSILIERFDGKHYLILSGGEKILCHSLEEIFIIIATIFSQPKKNPLQFSRN